MDRTSIFNALLERRVSPAPSPQRRPAKGRGLRRWAFALIGAAMIGSLASPATAASEPSTKLIRCAEQDCLQISGRRADPAAIISINGHAVPVEGEHRWRVRLPVEVVRQWSAPH